jgi:acyl-coenzyme A synthetase/AMP-(fatty) acid ligase
VVRLNDANRIELEPRIAANRTNAPGVVVFTSGSTGKPKGVEHSWETIAASSRLVPERIRSRRWYAAYECASYAGLQVFYAASSSQGRLIVPPVGNGFAEHARLICTQEVDIVSATPSWWRMLMSAWPADLPRRRLLQATLGGEIADQATLDHVSEFFSAEQLTHVFATSETGTAIAVSDRKAGFTAAHLDDPRRTVKLRVRDGVLQIKSPHRMRRYVSDQRTTTEDEWLSTGDLVEVVGGRCHFAGRKDQQLNIGGLKVKPQEVEIALRRLPEVRDCVAYARPNPIVGTVLVADVVAADATVDHGTLRRRLRKVLPAYKVPQQFRFVERIGMLPSGKAQRH